MIEPSGLRKIVSVTTGPRRVDGEDRADRPASRTVDGVTSEGLSGSVAVAKIRYDVSGRKTDRIDQ